MFLPDLTDDVVVKRVEVDLDEDDVILEVYLSVSLESTASSTPETVTSTGLRLRGLVAI